MDLNCLDTLMKNDIVQNLVTENEEIIVSGAAVLGEYPQVVKDYVLEHLDTFIDEDVKTTFENIKVFTEASVSQFMSELSDQMVSGEVITE